MTESSSYSSDTINVWTQSYSSTSDVIAITYGLTSGSLIEGNVYVKINENRSWGDVSAGDRGVIDYESATTHEFGHVAGLIHNYNRQSVMYESLSEDVSRPYPNWYDRQAMRSLYS